jgi:hypothetical protein
MRSGAGPQGLKVHEALGGGSALGRKDRMHGVHVVRRAEDRGLRNRWIELQGNRINVREQPHAYRGVEGRLGRRGGVEAQSVPRRVGRYIADGSGTFVKCTFNGDKEIAIFSEGVTGSAVSESGCIGLVFDGNTSGRMSDTTIEKNGECVCQCIHGKPELVNNEIKSHSRFGVFIFRPSLPVVEGTNLVTIRWLIFGVTKVIAVTQSRADTLELDGLAE